MPVTLQNIAQPLKRKILNIPSLTVRDGEFVGVLDAGEGGAEVLGELFCGLLRPEHGEVSLTAPDGEHPAAAVFFDCECEKALFEESAEKEVSRRIKGAKLPEEERSARVKEALELVGFSYEAIKDCSPFELTAGERRRVALAAGLVMQPDVLVLNDPMRDMDGLWCSKLMELLEKLHRRGMTVILLTSEGSRLSQTAERIIVLKDGNIVADSTAKNVFSEYYALVHLGLAVPEVRKCCQLLRSRGMDMPNNIILYDQFIDRLKILMWRKNHDL